MSTLITLNDFLTNPAGKGSGQVSARYVIISNLKERFNEVKIKKIFNFKIFHKLIDKKNNIYEFYAYFKIPSEHFEKLSYDVFLKFSPDSNPNLLSSYKLQFISNIPSFIFTYAYICNREGLIINELKNKLPAECLTKAPEVRNPTMSFGFEKSLYFAALFIKENKLDNLSNILNVSEPYDPNIIKKLFVKFDDKLAEYDEFKDEEIKKNAKEREKQKQTKVSEHAVKQTKNIKQNKNSATTKLSKATKSLKKTKKIS